MDPLEDADVSRPPPIILPAERAQLASVALAQKQLGYLFAFGGGLVGGAALAYAVGYHDEILRLVRWIISGTGIALVFSVFNTQRLSTFKCPRCGERFFSGLLGMFSTQCGTCGLPVNLHDDYLDLYRDESAKTG